ncbi:ras GTPase-activating-like protein IQGAP1 isoform X1 [Lampetra planeri]
MAQQDDADGFAKPYYGSIMDDERMTAEQMDARRRQNVAYEYLCHLEEAKRWLEACIVEELPPTTELEESLRNGVILAKLGHFFMPGKVSLKKIYDREQTRYKAMGLHFRHTDNINHWLIAMVAIGLPKIFYPETTDIYDRKNMPKTIYCIHALSLYLFKLGLAPQIQDLFGKVNFTEEEIDNMRKELEKYGIQMPAFSKIGGILASELSVDEAALHAAVIAINDAVEKGDPAETVAALRNPSAMLLGLEEELAEAYQSMLRRAKLDKANSARNRGMVDDGSIEEKDVYEELLTQAEIQGNINTVNTQAALERVDAALRGESPEELMEALRARALALHGVELGNARWYLERLSSDRDARGQDTGRECQLGKEDLQAGVERANSEALRHHLMLKAVEKINAAIGAGEAQDTVLALQQPDARLPPIHPFAASLYQLELGALQSEMGELSHGALCESLQALSALALVNQALDARDTVAVATLLANQSAVLASLDKANLQRYVEALMELKAQALSEGREHVLWSDIRTCVDDINVTVQEEHDRVLAIGQINEALEEEEPVRTLEALQLPAVKLSGVEPALTFRYRDVLRASKRRKAKEMADESAVLWLDEIQEGVHAANKDNEAANSMAAAVAAVNSALGDAGDSVAETLLGLLRTPGLALRGVTPECTASYHLELSDAKREKAAGAKGESSDGPWSRHRLRDGSDFFFNRESGEGRWEAPQGVMPSTGQLSRDEIQAVVGRVTSVYNRERLWLTHEALVARLQARGRGYLVRRALLARREFLTNQQPAITTVQAYWRGCKQRKVFRARLQLLRDNTPAVVKIQAWVRMWLAAKRYRARLQFFRDHIPEIVKIQAFLRANKAREDYRILIGASNPPLPVLRKFVHLLEQSDLDIQEELEIMRLREEVVTTIRSNQQLEQDLNTMDIKIGLLVKNRITLQDVVMHSKKLNKKNREELQGMMVADQQKGLKSLSLEKRKRLEAYQHLFYLLQTNPSYLAKLIFLMPQNRSTKFVDSVVFTLYNYASNQREEYLLLKLFKSALEEEIKSKVDHLQEIVTGNPTVIKMVVTFHRGVRGQNAMQTLLGPLVKEIIEDKSFNVNTNPVEIYKAWVNQMESQTGEMSNLPYDVTSEQALAHEEVRKRLEASLQSLRTATDKVLSSIIAALDKIPYGMRFIAKVLKNSLQEKFPDATEDDLLKIVGNLLYYRYMNPAIVAPDAFDVLELGAGETLRPEQRRSLAFVARMLQSAAANQRFEEGDASHMGTLSEYTTQAFAKFKKFFQSACDVPGLEEKFNVDEYSDLVTLSKPIIYISIGEIIDTHTLLLEHQEAIAPDHNDPLIALLEDLGDVPDICSLGGETEGENSDPNKEAQLLKTEVSLTLTNKFDVMGDDDLDTKGLLLRTKKLVVDVIRAQPGESLTEILSTAASSEQEADHDRVVRRRAVQDARAPEKVRRDAQGPQECELSLAGKKERILCSLEALEKAEHVCAADKYQAFINDIAKDIRNQRRYRQRRKAELVKLQQTLVALNSKTTFYQEQTNYYNQYIQTCLDNLAHKGKSGRKGKAEEKSGRKGKPQVLHYTAARLYEKGVLLEIEDVTLNQFKNVLFDITKGEKIGIFEVKAKFMGVEMEKVELNFQDLLQLQYEGVAVMKMFERARVNVNLLIFLLNKKLYGK